MSEAASGGQRQHRLVAQRVGRQAVEEQFEQPAVRGLVDRRGDQHALRPRQRPMRLRDLRIGHVASDQCMRRQLAHRDRVVVLDARTGALNRVLQQPR